MPEVPSGDPQNRQPTPPSTQGAGPQISKIVDPLDGHQGFHYGANAETLGATYVAVAVLTDADGDDTDVRYYDQVRFIAESHMTAWVFGLRAKRGYENPAVAVMEPVDIIPEDMVAAITVNTATDTLTDLPGDSDSASASDTATGREES